MAQHDTARWIVTYDIACRKRWAPIFKLLKKHGVPVQYSVFSVDASAVMIGSLMQQIGVLIDPRQDDVRAYRIPEHGEHYTLGQPMLPADMWIDPGPAVNASHRRKT